MSPGAFPAPGRVVLTILENQQRRDGGDAVMGGELLVVIAASSRKDDHAEDFAARNLIKWLKVVRCRSWFICFF